MKNPFKQEKSLVVFNNWGTINDNHLYVFISDNNTGINKKNLYIFLLFNYKCKSYKIKYNSLEIGNTKDLIDP